MLLKYFIPIEKIPTTLNLSLISCFLSFMIYLCLGKNFITFLQKLRFDQQIRMEYLPEHQKKKSVPPMGGILIIASVLLSSAIFVDCTDPSVLAILFALVSFGALGFADDYSKISQKSYHGMSAKSKFILQYFLALITYKIMFMYNTELGEKSKVFLHYPDLFIDLKVLYPPIASLFVISGTANAVNITDGLDGLATFPIVMICIIFLFLSLYLPLPIISLEAASAQIPIICGALIGSSLGFLWFNTNPATIFMGDVGSLSLGAVLGTISMALKRESVLAIAGFMFVLEILSVVIQVSYFKITKGKRIFLMTPIHHHFEKLGLAENKIVVRFWIMTIILCMISVAINLS